MGDMRQAPDCALVRDLIPELAAGVAAGDERARALKHLAGCASCRAELEQAATVVDDLLMLAPGHEPSPGFEQAVLAAIASPPPGAGPAVSSRRAFLSRPAGGTSRLGARGPGATRGPGTRWRRTKLRTAVAALVVIAAGTSSAAVWQSTAADRQLAASYRKTLAVAAGSSFTAATIYAGHGSAGHVFAYQGAPSWIFLTVQAAPGSGAYDAWLVTRDGARVQLGQVAVADGKASWGTTVNLPITRIQFIELAKRGSPAMIARLSW
jgi:hypothetical protein